MEPIIEIKSVLKRCAHFADYNPPLSTHTTHPLAAPIYNFIDMFDSAEYETAEDYQYYLHRLLRVCRVINEYCDNNHVKIDETAKYLLSLFEWFYYKNQKYDLSTLH